MALTLVRDRVTLVAYAQLAIFGYFLYGFSPVIPILHEEQHTSRGVAGLHGTAMSVGNLVVALVMPKMVRRFGRVPVMWTGMAGLGAAVVGLTFSHAFVATLTCTMVAAGCGTVMVNCVVVVLAEHHGAAGPAAISEANAVCAGIGAISPLVVGSTMSAGLGWRPGLAVVLLLMLALGAVAVFQRRQEPGQIRGREPAPPTGRRLPRPFWWAWLSLLATGSFEVTLNLWTADVLRDHAGLPAGVATSLLSALVIGMCVGRLVGVRLVLRFAAARILLGALTVCTVSFAVFWIATVPWLAVAGLVVCGLGAAQLYPMAVGLAMEHSARQPDLAASRITYGVCLMYAFAPFGLGALADRIGPHQAFLSVFLLIGVAAFAGWQLRGYSDRNMVEVANRSPLTLAGDGHTVSDRKHDRLDPVVGDDHVVELHDNPVSGCRRGEDSAVA